MKCVVPGPNIKVLARAIHSLAKIGEDLYIDPKDEGLALRTVNSSRSAFVSYTFKPSFFSSYSHKLVAGPNQSRCEITNLTSQRQSQKATDVLENNTENQDNDSKCKVTMRGIMIAFKSISQLEKTAESCLITVCSEICKLKIRIICKYSVTKTYTLPFIESDSLMANYDQAGLCNVYIAQAKILTEAVLNFLNNQEEVTMIVNQNQFSMKNFVEDEDANGPKKMVHSQLTMQPTEFEDFKITKESNVTFCLKELRSIISFADAMNLPLKASFNNGGEPIVFNLNSPHLFEATLVMATLAEQRKSDQLNAKENDNSLNTSKADGHISTQESLNEINRQPRIPAQHILPDSIRSPQEVQAREKRTDVEKTDIHNSIEETSAMKKHPFVLSSRADFDESSIFAAARKTNSPVGNSSLPQGQNGSSFEPNTKKIRTEETNNTPPPSNRLKVQTPLSTRVQYIFKRTVDATFNPTNVCGSDIILASDSEEENS